MIHRIITGTTTETDAYLAVTLFVIAFVGGGFLGYISAILFN